MQYCQISYKDVFIIYEAVGRVDKGPPRMISDILPQPIILLYLFQPFDLYFDVQKTLMMINNEFVHINLIIVQ